MVLFRLGWNFVHAPFVCFILAEVDAISSSGARKSFFSRVLAPKRYLASHSSQLTASEDAARAPVPESTDTVLSGNAQRQAPPDNLESGDTYH